LQMNLIIILVKLVPEWLKKFLLQMVCVSILLPYAKLSVYMTHQRKKWYFNRESLRW